MANLAQTSTPEPRRFGMRDKLAYAAGDLGCNMSFALKNTVSIFWTQYMGISLEAMAVLMLLVQIWDGINDPIIGSMVDADQHHYKRNKFLQYIWAGSVGLLVAGAAMFLPIPGAPMFVKYALFVAGYILWDAFYTLANVPYGSILSLITTDPGERAELSSFRSLGGMGGGILVGILLPFLIYDADNNLKGNTVFWAALIMGFLGYLCFQFMIRNTVLRAEPTAAEQAPKVNIFRSFGSFFRNRAAVGATLAVIGQFIGTYGAQYATTAMWQSYFHNASLSGLMGMISYIPMFLFVPFIKKIVARWGKKEAVVFGCAITCLGYGLLVVLPIRPDVSGMILWVIGQLLAGFGMGVYSCVSWSMMADAMDYGEWKFGVREEGTTYALHSFFRKLAQGVGPSVGLMVAASLGFVEANAGNQTFEVALNMRYQAAWSFFIGSIVTLLSVALVYNLDRKTLARIESDLAQRRATP